MPVRLRAASRGTLKELLSKREWGWEWPRKWGHVIACDCCELPVIACDCCEWELSICSQHLTRGWEWEWELVS
jgi:hypothetical protein